MRLVIASLVVMAGQATAHEYPITVERFLDADTFDGEIDLSPLPLTVPARFRVMCINAPESRGQHKSEAGVAMSEMVKGLGLKGGVGEIVGKDAFGRYLIYFRATGWDISLNRFLFQNGAPLYSRLTRASRAECERRLGITP